jgi:hypothetical protein
MSFGPNCPVNWTIRAACSNATSGLAGFTVDIVQQPGNPQTIDIPPGNAVPTRLSGFSRPAGISNPSPNGNTPGYCGTPVGAAGARNLRDIGGVQNTFGVFNAGLGEDISVESDIALGTGGEVILSGSFLGPPTLGPYRFVLENGVANVLVVHSTTGPSYAFEADVVLEGDINFTIRCVTDVDDGSGTGTPDGGVTIDDLLYYNVLFAEGDSLADVDDGTGTGACDGGVTVDDLLYFLDRFTSGC